MTKSDIITKFELYMDDMSELSTTESENLFDKVYNRVNSDRPWEGTKTEYTGTAPVTLPDDFLFLVQNYNYTDETEYGSGPFVFVDSEPVKVVSWSDRNRYTSDVAYLDMRNNTMEFASDETGSTVSFDYHASLPTLLNAESPWFPASFHDIIYHGMCAEAFMIMQAEKAKSYANEHLAWYNKYLGDMAMWNARLIQN
jgi:hypothetical protein